MKKFLVFAMAAVAALVLASSVRADVILADSLSGTGDNVIFDSLNGNLAIGSFNGTHSGFVNFTDLQGNPLFTGAQNGNDIKISNTDNLQVQVFNTDGSALGTTTQVFSLKGTGDVTAFMFAVSATGVLEAAQIFDLGTINPDAQSGFTFTTINGEVMTKMILVDAGTGVINDYEHYRIDAAAVPVPGPIVGAGIPGLVAACFGLIGLAKRRRSKQVFA